MCSEYPKRFTVGIVHGQRLHAPVGIAYRTLRTSGSHFLTGQLTRAVGGEGVGGAIFKEDARVVAVSRSASFMAASTPAVSSRSSGWPRQQK